MYSGGIAEPVSCNKRVLFMQPNFVIVAKCYGNATLRVFGGRFAKTVFRNDQDSSGFGQLDSSAKSGHTCTDYDEVCLNALDRRVDIHMILGACRAETLTMSGWGRISPSPIRGSVWHFD